MPGIDNNLYPPIISTYMPAFVRTTPCKVYFSLSNFNNISDILNAQVVVNNQNTNLSALRSDLYPAGIKITTIGVDETIQNENKYYVVINPSDMINNSFNLNQFYKVQIRFTKVGATPLNSSDKISPWLIENQKFFSEWSTVCLIRAIQQPRIYLKGFEENKDSIIISNFINASGVVGKLYFDDEDAEYEYLEFYRIRVYDVDDNKLKYDSGDIYTNPYNPNEINSQVKVLLEDGINYKMIFSYFTVNGYTEDLNYNFMIIQNSTTEILDATIGAEPDDENGRMIINIKPTKVQPFMGHLLIKRSSSKTNFTIWEDINKKTLSAESLSYTWMDYTCESGVLYHYCVQKIDSEGNGGIIVKTKSPAMLNLEDIFLFADNIQIKVKFNPSISSFKNTILENKVETLGSKYPYIIRNGNVNYKEFSISGLISSLWDEEGNFIDRDSIYKNNKKYYLSYNEENEINDQYDYIFERFFREKITDFLYKDNIKLFKSNTEGNILIKLMNITLSPNETLGRMLYNFSATACEVDECSVLNYQKYNIIDIDSFENEINTTYLKLGQINGKYSGSAQDIRQVIQDKYDIDSNSAFVNKVNTLNWIRINFNSDPYLIKNDSNGNPVALAVNENPQSSSMYGHIVYIDGTPIVVNQNSPYELIDEDTTVSSIYFPVESDVTIDYIAEISIEERTRKIYNKISYVTKVSQESGVFDIEENVFEKIYLKHLVTREKVNRQLLSLNKVVIEGDIGTVIYVKDSSDYLAQKYVLGSTGVLEFFDEDTVIESLYFGGIQLYPKIGDVDRINNFSETEISVLDFNEITNPKERNVYIVNNERWIYYRDSWYKFTDDNIVLCPVYCLIDYIFEEAMGEYN